MYYNAPLPYGFSMTMHAPPGLHSPWSAATHAPTASPSAGPAGDSSRGGVASDTEAALFDGHMTSCPICLDDFVTGSVTTRLGCRHAFHKTCYEQLLSKARTGVPECPVCRGSSPTVATFTYRGPDAFDEAEEEVLIATVALDEAREEQSKLKSRLEDAHEDIVDLRCRLESALLAYDDAHRTLETAKADLQRTHAGLVEYQRAYRACKESLWEEEEEHLATAQQLRQTYRGHAEQGRLCRVRSILAGMGGKCAPLAADSTISLCTVAYAAAARHRRTTKLLVAQRQQHKAVVANLGEMAERAKEEHASVVATLKDALGNQREREKCAEQALKAARREVTALQAERTTQESLAERLATAEAEVAALRKKLDKTTARSREVSARLFAEKASLEKQLVQERTAAAAPPACSICMENARRLVCFWPCGHARVCTGCDNAVKQCPFCSRDIQQRAQLFM